MIIRIKVKPSYLEHGYLMRITKAKAAENRERVLETATRLFRERGFDGVGVADLMREAGLTHGAFYNHFDSKTELEAEACGRAFERSVEVIGQVADRADAADRAAAYDRFVENYLSIPEEGTGPRCAMVAFAGDVSRQSDEVKRVFAHYLDAYIDRFVAAFPSAATPEQGRAEALANLAGLVGAVVLARSVRDADRPLSDEILAAGKAAARLDP
jgi:TetR/AcrR family transcriptional repressor of nem operon